MPRDFPHLLDSKNLPDSLKSRVHGLFSWKYFLFKISNLCVREIIDWAGTFVFKHCFKKSDVFHKANHCVLHGHCDILQNLLHFLLWLIADNFGILRTLSGINWGQFWYFRTIPLKMKIILRVPGYLPSSSCTQHRMLYQLHHLSTIEYIGLKHKGKKLNFLLRG